MSVWIFAAHVLERDTMCKSDVNSLLTAFWMSAKYPGGAPLAVFYKHREGWIHEYVNKHIHKKPKRTGTERWRKWPEKSLKQNMPINERRCFPPPAVWNQDNTTGWNSKIIVAVCVGGSYTHSSLDFCRLPGRHKWSRDHD